VLAKNKATVLDLGTVSGVRFTVGAVESPDVADPHDAELQHLLTQLAEMTTDTARREKTVDLILTLRPMAHWPPEAVDECREAYEYVRGLREQHERQEFKRMIDDGDI
jgi:hypothetical protein